VGSATGSQHQFSGCSAARLLAFLLFAGAMHIDLLTAQATASDSGTVVLSTVLSTVLIGLLSWGVFLP